MSVCELHNPPGDESFTSEALENRVVAHLKRMQHGTPLLVRGAKDQLEICVFTLGDDLKTIEYLRGYGTLGHASR